MARKWFRHIRYECENACLEVDGVFLSPLRKKISWQQCEQIAQRELPFLATGPRDQLAEADFRLIILAKHAIDFRNSLVLKVLT